MFDHKKIQAMKKGGHMLASIMRELKAMAKPGVTTGQLNAHAEARTAEFGGTPAFKGFDNFPAGLCTSINEGMVHGLPGNRVLQEGDVLKLDYGVLYDGFYTDHAITVPIGNVDAQSRRLIDVTREALNIALQQVKPRATTGDIGAAAQAFIENNNMGLVRILCGHGIGRDLHGAPQIPNFGRKGEGTKLKAGMTIAVEPMVTLGTGEVRKGDDGFVFESVDGTQTAHFEHTVLVTQNGCEILTK